ncbi:hypothetical protein MMC21_006873 [Puttea exsequens]|nr:hypothetical protein [Puttea exsequens]
MFEVFRSELDAHQERRERVIKASRDITALSKKMIRDLGESIQPKVAKENEPRQKQICDLFTSIAPDLQGINAWRYQRNISGGLQEYVEAMSFQHYLENQVLITYAEAQSILPHGILLTEDDYILGLFDMVGELMRFAITTMATTGALPRGMIFDGMLGRDVLTDLRGLRTCFESLDTMAAGGNTFLKRDIDKKMEVMRTCVEKVENAMYGMIIRGRERPKGWVPDLDEEERREVVSY